MLLSNPNKIYNGYCRALLYRIKLNFDVGKSFIFFRFNYSRAERGNLVLRHCVLHFPHNFWGIAGWVAELNAALQLCGTRARNEKNSMPQKWIKLSSHWLCRSVTTASKNTLFLNSRFSETKYNDELWNFIYFCFIADYVPVQWITKCSKLSLLGSLV